MTGWYPCPECCDGDCWYFEDTFTRDNSTNVGAAWNEIASSDWEILDNELHEKIGGGGTSNALIIGTGPVPADSAGQMFIRVKFIDAQVGDVFFIHTCCESSSAIGSGITVEFEYTDTNEWTITIDAGGDGTSVVQQADDGSGGAYVCADNRVDMVTAGMILTVDEPAWADDLDPGDGRYYGLGHDNTTNGGTFDDFYVIELKRVNKECTNCVCQCQEWGLSKHLVATITDCELIGGDGDGNNLLPCCAAEQEFDLIWDFDGVQGPGWYGTWINSLDPPGAFSIDIFLECGTSWLLYPDWPGRNIVITFQPGFGANVSADPPIADESDCNPLSLVYGWYTHTIDVMDPPVDITQYKIVVTKAS